jgi:hypothetical protein
VPIVHNSPVTKAKKQVISVDGSEEVFINTYNIDIVKTITRAIISVIIILENIPFLNNTT